MNSMLHLPEAKLLIISLHLSLSLFFVFPFFIYFLSHTLYCVVYAPFPMYIPFYNSGFSPTCFCFRMLNSQVFSDKDFKPWAQSPDPLSGAFKRTHALIEKSTVNIPGSFHWRNYDSEMSGGAMLIPVPVILRSFLNISNTRAAVADYLGS